MRSALSLLALVVVTAPLFTACGDDTGEGGAGGAGSGGAPGPSPLPPLTKAPLTTEERIEPTKAVDTTAARNPRDPADVEAMLKEGFGDFEIVAGEPSQPLTLDMSTPPAAGPNAKLVARFVHLSDIQLADDESGARVVNVDSPMGATAGAFRPQEGHECRILNAAVRTIDKIHEATPLDFVVLGGDNADNAQTNEVDWVLSILGGAPLVSCDSGIDDDPVSGPDNDPKDPFIADGLAMPWFWVTGNHDILNQGNIPPTIKESEYLGSYAAVGARNWSEPGGPVILGDIPPDPQRAALFGPDLLTTIKADGDGHGITDDAITRGRAFYSFDPAPKLRVIVIDTAAPTGSADGLLRQSEIDEFLIPALETAQTEGRYVIVTSHHSSTQLTDGGGVFGMAQPDAVLGPELRDVLGSYPNVLMHLAGHTHTHKAARIQPATSPHAYWEVETAALADFPHQMRMIEVWEQDNGFVSVKLVAFDYQTEGDPVAEEGRKIGILDFTSGWQGDGTGTATDRNVELYVPAP